MLRSEGGGEGVKAPADGLVFPSTPLHYISRSCELWDAFSAIQTGFGKGKGGRGGGGGGGGGGGVEVEARAPAPSDPS